ncbi:phosphoribosyltransferase [Sporocytophaga myxococcoides]|uniref:phosphoribosyltransferase n=1 Tax=Sporocytophaga myxococcoides TaxID=153721 RepID=UPI000419F73C|nr:phosphoribosyltransferase family protein [Sporocytophaga myxococcoides]
MYGKDTGRIFTNREDAGIQLGNQLSGKFKDKNALVLAIPRGGVEVAYHVAKILNGELSVVISKKLPYPGQPELACGAIAEDESVYLSALGKRLDESTIKALIKDRLQEIKRRILEYREGKPLPNMKNRTVIIVDDGIATGSTIVPILQLCRKHEVSELIVAAPVSGNNYADLIHDLSDEVIVLEIPSSYYAVGQVYVDFHQNTDDEVISFLQKLPSSR